jgi:hypothetical protein
MIIRPLNYHIFRFAFKDTRPKFKFKFKFIQYSQRKRLFT